MSDQFISSLKENEAILAKLSDDAVVLLALSKLMMEMCAGKDVPPGTKVKGICLSADLARRAGVKW